MRIKIKTLKIILALLVVGVWCSELLNYSIVGQVRAQDSQFVDPEDVFDQYMETFDREQTVLERESNKAVTREAITEDIIIEAERLANSTPTVVGTLTVP